MIYILIDSSYLIFYRYYALVRWWSFAMKDTELGIPANNPLFCEKFEKSMIESVSNIKRDLKKQGFIPKEKKEKKEKEEICVIGCRDCPRLQIWRNELYADYKATRVIDDEFLGGAFFKKVFNGDLLDKAGCHHILQRDNLEADDIVAITANYLKKTYPEAKIFIIANDADYLQLCSRNCEILNLKMDILNNGKNSYNCPHKNLFMKIILGDKSDNICPVFSRCSKKLCEELYENPDLFAEKLHNEDAYEKLLINKMIIDFKEIPEELSQDIEWLLDGIL